MFNYSYSNMLLVSDDYYDLLKDNLDISYFFKDDVLKLYSNDSSIYLENEKALLPKGYYYDNLVYLEGDELSASSFAMSIDKYVNYLSSTNQLDESIEISLPKEFIFGASSDTLINEKPSAFLTNLDLYALNYIAAKNYKSYFDDNKFDINLYASKYFKEESYDLDNLLEEDKVGIFKLYLETVLLNYPKNSNDASLHKENQSYLVKLTDYLINTYDELFSVRDFTIEFSDNSIVPLKLVALDSINKVNRFYFDETNSLKFLENPTNYYTALIALNKFNDEELNSLVFSIEDQKMLVNNISIKEQDSLKSISESSFIKYLTIGIIFIVMFIALEFFTRFKVEKYFTTQDKESVLKASKDTLINILVSIILSSIIIVVSLLITNVNYGLFLTFDGLDFLYIFIFSALFGLIQVASKLLLEKTERK